MNLMVNDAPPPRFTDKQGQYLAFIWAYAQINGRPPAERDMQSYFRVTAPSVHQMVITLENAGSFAEPQVRPAVSNCASIRAPSPC